MSFDNIADQYDRWYDLPAGNAAFNAELGGLRRLCKECRGRWLEVGVGTGRFASMLAIGEGIDPSHNMLAIAEKRGIKTYEGYAEKLPFPDYSFDGILLAMTLCFVDDPKTALSECFRVLSSEGNLLVGIIPENSPWGRDYKKKQADGHVIYAKAHFLTSSEAKTLITNAGFFFQGATSTLFWQPGGTPQIEPRIENGIVSEAGFLGMLFTKNNGTIHVMDAQ
jgi:ubiquinone/menaquinone biosynthesis C-methylase UbiE